MNNIRMIYRYSEVEPSVFLLLYFRMMGVYITERFLDQKVDLSRHFSVIQEKDVQTILPNSESILGDVDIILVNRRDDYDRARKYFNGDYIVIATSDLKNFIDDTRRVVWYAKNAEKKMLKALLLQLMEMISLIQI